MSLCHKIQCMMNIYNEKISSSIKETKQQKRKLEISYMVKGADIIFVFTAFHFCGLKYLKASEYFFHC